jgi:hypothetical protein
MTITDAHPDHECNSLDSQATITIDPLSFFQYASSGENRWRELIGFTINHCTFGLGTIRKIDGDYIYVDLPERQEKKHPTEFGLDSFRRGFFNNLRINSALQQKMIAAAAASQEPPAAPEIIATEPVKRPAKKKRTSKKVTKKAAE